VRPSAAAAAAPRRDPLYRGHRFPAEGLGQAGWRSFRFAGSHRHGEDLLAARGVPVS
jgi:putative transposase